MKHSLLFFGVILILLIFIPFNPIGFENRNNDQDHSTENSVTNGTDKENLIGDFFDKYSRHIKKSKKESIKITFVGDMMFDRAIRKIAERTSYDYIFENVKKELNNSDLVIGNLEGPVTTYPSKNYLDTYNFTFDPKSLKSVFESNIKIVSIDNNHILNFGRDGLNQTINNLNQNNIQYFGNPDKKEVLYKNLNGINLAFISYNQFLGNNQTNKLISEASKQSDWVIVYAHWGDEYQTIANKYQVELAHDFVDSGADIVIGAHPHVIQNKERYKDKWIYYSLGNFVFDQWFDENVRCGATISFELEIDKIKNIEEKFVYLEKDGRTVPSNCSDSVKELPI